MHIRNATYRDAPAIKLLLEALGYNTSLSLLVNQLEILFGGNDHEVFVYELHSEVVGFVAIHYMPRLAFEEETAFISFLLVADTVKDQRIDMALEQYATKQATARKCDRIQVHSLDWLSPGHQFYISQGYQEITKYFTKKIDRPKDT